MKEQLLRKYFQDRCSHEELEQVLRWFQTKEGQRFLQEDMDQEWELPTANDLSPVMSSTDSEELFRRIQRHKKKKTYKRPNRWGLLSRVAGVILILTALSSVLWWQGAFRVPQPTKASPEITYKTTANQQKILTLSDGTTIRLNERSSLKVPEDYIKNERNVILKGEAYFEVVHNPDRPFIVRAGAGRIVDLGTKFNVNVDSASGQVQVAVQSGKVSLEKRGHPDSSAQAILSAHHFGLLNDSSGQITIEKGNQQNYLSWMNGRLVFQGQSLASISRQLERIYSVKVQFQSDQLKRLNLTAVLQDTSLRSVLSAISQGLDITVRKHGKKITWTK